MPDRKLLETFPTPSALPFVIEHTSDEFTSVCPKTGHPDFATIVLRYQPATSQTKAGKHGCVELKSLKLYYQSFRNQGIYYEAVTNAIRDDLARTLKPTWLQVIAHFKGRGGIKSTIRAEHGNVPAAWKTL
ncbi:MAG: preQ(1) synthase [Phycisphaeraceae bacterium]|jgi:7-cyano-7-deazaguanine reductase|nr:preQ(1) synthase [Phycisphaeraceae bacterium]